jgi:serine/threonine protein kinase
MAAAVLLVLAVVAAVLLVIYVVTPIFKGLGVAIAAIFRGLGWFIRHIFEFVAGMLGDSLRFIGSIVAMIVLMPLTVLNVVIGRWSAAGHFADGVKRECRVAGTCLYRVLLQRPLRLFMLHGLLEGVEQRVPEAMAAAPTADKPGKRVGQFAGYRIVGSLKGGGSGAKLYIAEPDADVRLRYPGMPDRVVIKTFALSEGSSLPQIVRESRALECAKMLGLVFEHGMDAQRFYYVMPYHAGDHLGIVTRQLHGEAAGDGLKPKQLATALGYIGDIVRTLSIYHEGGLWHKDIKPENIIIHDNRANLVDLGLVTPLRSAMTLTTHGTEYFRDPEMVRQALRGVKVHQVNGAKFDIFAAGAVLYFLIENTFPPHGALSRFSKKSPDALRWIVRRAMADYNHRYDTATEMLADLHAVAAAEDPFSVKPASLPSMSGGAAPVMPEPEPAPEFVASAGSPVPPASPEEPAAAAEGRQGSFKAGPVFATWSIGGKDKGDEERTPGVRPKLRVTNWWTGSYHVDDAGSGSVAGPRDVARMAREGAYEMRERAAEMQRKVSGGAMSARAAARQQIKSARARAREIRRNAKATRRSARAHRRHAVAERQPSAALILISVVFLSVIGLLLGALFMSASRSSSHSFVHVFDEADAVESPAAGRLPLILLPDLVDPEDERAAQRIDEIVASYEKKGYEVVIDAVTSDEIRDAYLDWLETDTGDDYAHHMADDHLEDLLEKFSLYGVLSVSEQSWPGAPDWSLDPNLVWSTRPGAKQRRFAEAPAPAPELPYLLVNDHPTKHDPVVEERIEKLLDRYEALGWTVIVDDEAEVAVRQAMPPGPIESFGPIEVPEAFHRVLDRKQLGGVLYVHTHPGSAPAAERIVLTELDADGEQESDTGVEIPEGTFETTSSGRAPTVTVDWPVVHVQLGE